jgi:hypothetical protein
MALTININRFGFVMETECVSCEVLKLVLYITYKFPDDIPFFKHVKYLSVIFDKIFIWRQHIEITEAKAFGTFVRIYSAFKNERLSIKITLHKALIRSVMTYAYPTWELAADTCQITAITVQGSPHHWKFSKGHTGPRFAHGFQPSVYIRLYNKIV